jgi:hypothetical protein
MYIFMPTTTSKRGHVPVTITEQMRTNQYSKRKPFDSYVFHMEHENLEQCLEPSAMREYSKATMDCVCMYTLLSLATYFKSTLSIYCLYALRYRSCLSNRISNVTKKVRYAVYT